MAPLFRFWRRRCTAYWRRLRMGQRGKHLLRILRYYSNGVYHQLTHKDIFLWAQAIAFKVLITIVPVIILATGVLGKVLQREKPFEAVATFIRTFLPPENSDDILQALQYLSNAGDFYTIIGVLGLLFSAMTLFTTLRVAVGSIFQEDWHENRSILGGYLFDLRMVGQVGLLFVLTFGLTLALRTLNTVGLEIVERLFLGWVFPFLLTTIMFYQLFYFVPKPKPPPLSALVGSLFTAVLWEAAKYGFTLYIANFGRVDRYSDGGESARAYLGDTFGLIIVFVLWIYYSGVVLLLGGIVALLHEKHVRSRRKAALEDARAGLPETADAPGGVSLPAATDGSKRTLARPVPDGRTNDATDPVASEKDLPVT